MFSISFERSPLWTVGEPFQRNVAIASSAIRCCQSVSLSVCLSVCIVTKQLQIGSRGFHCKSAKGLNYQHDKFENEIRMSPLDRGLNLCRGCSRLGRTVTARYILTYDVITSGHHQPIIVVAVGAINMINTAIHYEMQMQYSNRFYTTTSTQLRRIEACW